MCLKDSMIYSDCTGPVCGLCAYKALNVDSIHLARSKNTEEKFQLFFFIYKYWTICVNIVLLYTYTNNLFVHFPTNTLKYVHAVCSHTKWV